MQPRLMDDAAVSRRSSVISLQNTDASNVFFSDVQIHIVVHIPKLFFEVKNADFRLAVCIFFSEVQQNRTGFICQMK